MRSIYLLALLLGCGRIGFDRGGSLTTGDGSTIDARPDASFTDRHWVNRNNSAPGLLFAPRLVFHPGRGTVVMYGGGGGDTPGLSDSMWEWDGSTWTLLCSGCAPGTRAYHAMVYDSARDRIVLFGGRRGGALLGDLWEWDGATWTERTPAGNAPSGREAPQMAYDASRGRTVLFGGCSGGGVADDVYEYDGTSWFTPPSTGGPTVMGGYGNEAAYDPSSQRVLVLTDPCDVSMGRDALWSWNGTAWTQVCASCSMTPRVDSSLIWDLALGAMYLVGGFADGEELAGTWKLVGDEFQLIDSLPPKRDSIGIAYDNARDVIVMYGGNGDSCGNDCDETWEMVPD